MIEDEDSEGEDAETEKNKKNKNEKYEQKPEAQGLPEKNDTKITTPLVSQTLFFAI